MKIVSKIITATVLVAVFIIAALAIIDHGRSDIFPTFWTEREDTAATSPTDEPLSISTPALSPTPAPTPQPTLEPTPEPEPEYFVLSFAGDCTFAGEKAWIGSNFNFDAITGDDFSYPFYNVVDYFINDEFTIVNLECALTTHTTPKQKLFNFRADPKYVEIFHAADIEFANIANNHSYDYLDVGYAETQEHLTAAGIGFSGHDEWTVYETENGLRIGVYSADYIQQVIDPTEGILELKEQNPDIVIYAVHWGIEGSYRPNTTQIDNAYKAIDAGADIVFGTHPHVLQKIEEYNGKYILYSLGNFVFGGNTNPRDKDTAIIQITVERSGTGEVELVGYNLIPCSLSTESWRNNYQPIPYEDGSAEYDRAMSKLLGTFTGPNLLVDYSDLLDDKADESEGASPDSETPGEEAPPAESEIPSDEPPVEESEAPAQEPEAPAGDAPAEEPEPETE